ncbi:hypothetical protein [Streptomyces sp. JB150]|uniref:hypothetical protein n=1 Tax=Streptomyces sp. JB150 TaxID=2714844 RepID=UPI00140DDAB4|nr:hypothetical protein [Streptomyces sp. JB150]QIJ64189.1 hypothetical protein G7Z13_20895 [Streptomyces sp. JB150]
MTDPVSRTILLLDIERFSDRDDVEQAYLRRMLYDITDRALEAAGIDGTRRLRADRGDSVMELIDAGAPVTALLRALLREVPAQLRQVNRMSSRSAQIQLRGVVAAGYVAVDGHGGWVGSDLNHACRLLDADVLRAALRERRDDFALCVSESVHAGIVRHDHAGIPAEDFHLVTVVSKNGPLRAWLHGPLPAGAARTGEGGTAPREAGGTATATAASEDHGDRGAGEAPVPGDPGDDPAPGPQAPPRAQPPGGVVLTFLGGSPSFGGSLVAGDQHGVSGGQVTGDVHLGRSGGEPA